MGDSGTFTPLQLISDVDLSTLNRMTFDQDLCVSIGGLPFFIKAGDAFYGIKANFETVLNMASMTHKAIEDVK